MNNRIVTGVITSLLLLLAITCFAGPEPDPEYDEIPVYLSVAGVGTIEVPALIVNDVAYLPVTTVFDYLKIKNNTSFKVDSVYGFFIDPKITYLIDKKQRRIVFGEQVTKLASQDIILTETLMFLRAEYFGKVFGLRCNFNFRSLTVMLTTDHDLPVIREMRHIAMRNNIMRLTGEIKADTVIARSRPLFHAGTADWSVITTQNSAGRDNTRLNLAVGAIVAGGEMTVSLNYDSYASLQEKQQYYLWRLVNNNRKVVRQFMAGKIAPQSVSSIFSPVVGVQFTNAPTTYRRSFGSYVLSDRTEPNWLVELYVNNVLVNYVRADASGFFTFDVPLVYGNSAIRLRYYGPYGEERITEQNINIPFNFLPAGQFEYTVSAGVVEDSVHSRYSRASFNYGWGKKVTIGGGVEYLSSVASGNKMPFVNASVRLAPNMLYAAEYVYGVRAKQVLSYRLPSNLQFELLYSRYKKGQKAIANTFLEERKAVVSYPFRNSKFSLFSRATVYQIILPSFKGTGGARYTNAELLLSGVLFGINTNVTTYAVLTDQSKPFWYSNLSSTLRLPAKLIFTPQVQYEYNARKLMTIRGEMGKYLSSKGFANVFYEKNYKSGYEGVGIGFRYDLSFAQTSFSARSGNKMHTTVQSARGSLIYDSKAGYAEANNRSAVGKGGIRIVAFVDANGNGKRDIGEVLATGLRAQVSAGRIHYNRKDTSIVITDLEAYANYLVKLSTEGFDNIAWQVRNKVLSIETGPNQLRQVDVPVAVVGEVSGNVTFTGDKGTKGLGGIYVTIVTKTGKQVARVTTEADGFFSYFGLSAGEYIARMDEGQLSKLQMTAKPASIAFSITGGDSGNEAGGLVFTLQAQKENE